MDFRRRHRKKSNVMLVLMIILLVVIIGIMVMWNPTVASAQGKAQKQPTEQSDGIAETKAKAGTLAPDFKVTLTDGREIRLSALRGKYVLLNFWATWCPPCRAELKRVQKEIIDRYAGKNLVFIPVNRGEKADVVKSFLEKNGYGFAAGIDSESAVFNLYAEKYIPRNFIISPKGKVLKVEIGYEPEDFDKMIEYLDKTIK